MFKFNFNHSDAGEDDKKNTDDGTTNIVCDFQLFVFL